MSDFTMSSKQKRKILNKAQDFVKDLAKEAREMLTKEYLYVIQNFYSEYEPQYYLRHFKNKYDNKSLMTSGIGRTFEKYYKQHNPLSVSGGIWIDTTRHDGSNRNMFNDYNQSSIDVLNSFLNGYHGHKSVGIYSSIHPYNHMIKYRDYLVDYYFSEKATLNLG